MHELKLRAFLFKIYLLPRRAAVCLQFVCSAACRCHLLSLLPSLRCAGLPLSDSCSYIPGQKRFPFAGKVGDNKGKQKCFADLLEHAFDLCRERDQSVQSWGLLPSNCKMLK